MAPWSYDRGTYFSGVRRVCYRANPGFGDRLISMRAVGNRHCGHSTQWRSTVLKIDRRVLGVVLGAMAGPVLGAISRDILGDPALVDLTSVGIVLGATIGGMVSNLERPTIG